MQVNLNLAMHIYRVIQKVLVNMEYSYFCLLSPRTLIMDLTLLK